MQPNLDTVSALHAHHHDRDVPQWHHDHADHHDCRAQVAQGYWSVTELRPAFNRGRAASEV